MSQAQWMMKSRIGSLYLVASASGLQGVFWQEQDVPMVKSLAKAEHGEPELRILSQAVTELTQYLDGTRKSFSLPLDVQGTDFQKRVWEQLSKIPYGETCSYRDIAMRIQSDKAVRAVGTANGKNPVCIIVPCHRVIASDGTLGGYSGGLEIKTKLLELEKMHV